MRGYPVLSGAKFETLYAKTAKQLDIDGEVRVKSLSSGKLRRSTQMREGFIITKVDGTPVFSKEGLEKILRHKNGGVMLGGISDDIPGTYYYAFGLNDLFRIESSFIFMGAK